MWRPTPTINTKKKSSDIKIRTLFFNYSLIATALAAENISAKREIAINT